MGFQNPFMQQRQRNILAPQGGFGPNMRPTAQSNLSFDFPESDAQPLPNHRGYEDDISDLMTTQGPGLQAYKHYLTEMPQREEYKPGIMTRIASGLSGAAAGMRDPGEGIRVAQELNSSNYRNAIGDYANRGVGLKAQAEMEQDELDSKIRALQNARAMGLKYDEFELKRLSANNDMQNKTTTANAAMERAKAYAASVSKPGYDSSPQQDGSVLYINKNNPRDFVTVPAHTVQAGQLGVQRTNAATAATNARTAQGQLAVSQANASTNAARGAAYVENLGRDKTKPPLPRVQADAENNALRQMMTDPMFGDFIKMDSNGIPMPAEDDGSEEYQIFLEALDAKTEEVLKGTAKRKRTVR